MAGQKLKDETLKASLKSLREGGLIESRDGRWWAVKKEDGGH
jgi:hypothetical protein